MSARNRRRSRRRSRSKSKNIDMRKDEIYFSNTINMNKFFEMIIQDLSSFKIILEKLSEINITYKEHIENIEHKAFNLLITQSEFEKNNIKVEVGVIGSFSSGKSTFINSLFGESICPMAVKPTTSSITKFYYGHKKKITMNGKNISQEEYENSSRHLNGDTKNTKVNYIEYAYPFGRLNSIILYDTPGFNNKLNDNDEKITKKTLESVEVIFFIVDISKGALDKSSIEMLKKFQNKRMYCILNKSDLKTSEAIEKIKEEIASERLFTEVIEYSAYKVLEFAEKDYIMEHIKSFNKDYISKKIDFNTNIKGVLTERKTRIEIEKEYKLYIDNKEYIIDDFYTITKNQRDRVEKLLNGISESKKDTLKQKLKIDIYNYTKDSLSIAKEIFNFIDNINLKEGYFDKFNSDIKNFRAEVNQFTQDNIAISYFYKEWNDIFIRSCKIQDVEKNEKIFWSTPYSKIYFNQSYFKAEIKNMDSIKIMDRLIKKWVDFFKEEYSFELKYDILEIEKHIIKEALSLYSDFYNSDSYILNSSKKSIYFEDRVEAREFLNSFLKLDAKSTIIQVRYFVERYIGFLKGHLSTQDNINRKDIEKLKQELSNFIKRKEEYVNGLQKQTR